MKSAEWNINEPLNEEDVHSLLTDDILYIMDGIVILTEVGKEKYLKEYLMGLDYYSLGSFSKKIMDKVSKSLYQIKDEETRGEVIVQKYMDDFVKVLLDYPIDDSTAAEAIIEYENYTCLSRWYR